MIFLENGLKIVIFPPEGETITPNEKSQTKVNITNQQHESGVRLSVFLDLKSELQKWCLNSQQRITIGYLQSQEIEFLWSIPLEAIPGTYNYSLNVRFLRSTSFYNFQPKQRQLTVPRLKVKPQIHSIEPSFTITPASSSTRPIAISSGIPLSLEIEVHNRSNKTDNFRIDTDLETAWYTIYYPETIKRVGAIAGNNALNLNPGEKGQINFQLNPPGDTVAGIYKPEIELHSLNSPDLFLKKIVYLNIAPQYLLQAELQTILNKVSYKAGQYRVILTNQGNIFRAIELKAKTTDEDECCEYFLEPALVRISPQKTVEVKLDVKPNCQQKRPFLATKQFNFAVELIDTNNYPLPKNTTLKSSLFWQSRPLWQTMLLFILTLGFLGGCVWLIWRIILQPKPEAIVTLKAVKTEYAYGDPIGVDWSVKNPENIEKIILFDKQLSANNINTKCYYFDRQIALQKCTLIISEKIPERCQIERNTISCNNIIFYHAQKPQAYVFQLQALTNKEKIIESETEPVTILERTNLQIYEPLKTSQTQYQPTDNIQLEFETSKIDRFIGKDRIFLTIDERRQEPATITPDNIREYCSQTIGNRYICRINITQLSEGEYRLGIELQYDPEGLINPEPQKFSAPQTIKIQTPIKLDYFRINNSYSGTLEVEPDTPITVSWSVRGNAKVNIDCVGIQPGLQGSARLNVPPGILESCKLDVLDKEGKLVLTKTLRVKTKERPKPKPEPPTIILETPFHFPEREPE